MDKKTIGLMVFPFQGSKDTSPNYKVTAETDKGLYEDVGWGWKKESKAGTKFLSLSLDTAMLKKVYDFKYKTTDYAPQPNFDIKSNHDIEPEKEFEQF